MTTIDRDRLAGAHRAELERFAREHPRSATTASDVDRHTEVFDQGLAALAAAERGARASA